MKKKKYNAPYIEFVYVNMDDILHVSDFYFNEVDNGDLNDDWGSDSFSVSESFF